MEEIQGVTSQELERITLDPTQPISARILAAKTALPFLLATRQQETGGATISGEELVARINAGREQARLLRLAAEARDSDKVSAM